MIAVEAAMLGERLERLGQDPLMLLPVRLEQHIHQAGHLPAAQPVLVDRR